MPDQSRRDTLVDPSADQARKLAAPWLAFLRHYLIAIAAGNLIWEFMQLPLYTIWNTGSMGELIFAATHCTGGDILIATASLVLALVLFGQGWPDDRRAFRRVAAAAVLTGLGYTTFSEWLNTTIRKIWAYSELMPVVPVIETGLSPVLQWLLIPLGAFWWAGRLLVNAQSLVTETTP